jgi:hypothetical protein
MKGQKAPQKVTGVTNCRYCGALMSGGKPFVGLLLLNIFYQEWRN